MKNLEQIAYQLIDGLENDFVSVSLFGSQIESKESRKEEDLDIFLLIKGRFSAKTISKIKDNYQKIKVYPTNELAQSLQHPPVVYFLDSPTVINQFLLLSVKLFSKKLLLNEKNKVLDKFFFEDISSESAKEACGFFLTNLFYDLTMNFTDIDEGKNQEMLFHCRQFWAFLIVKALAYLSTGKILNNNTQLFSYFQKKISPKSIYQKLTFKDFLQKIKFDKDFLADFLEITTSYLKSGKK